MDMQPAPSAITAQAHRPAGFTLVELMVALAIAAILASIALPMYLDSVRKGRRGDAFRAIAAIQQAQERVRSNGANYSTASTADELSSRLNVTEPALYSIVVSAPASPATLSNGYIITAEGRAAQANDKACKKLSLRMLEGNITYAGCENCGSFTYSATHACWSR